MSRRMIAWPCTRRLCWILNPRARMLCTAQESIDTSRIRQSRPFMIAPWLQGEMRSNHAGETGAVRIYTGALWALSLRRRLGLGALTLEYEEGVRAFAEEHRKSEQWHLDLLEEVMSPSERSTLLPAWRVCGWCLGAVSTIWSPRGLYVTTDAVETFVEEHYQSQITRLKEEGGCPELIRMLEVCCADEVVHRDEARERAIGGSSPFVDHVWQAVVYRGSFLAAELAKRI